MRMTRPHRKEVCTCVNIRADHSPYHRRTFVWSLHLSLPHDDLTKIIRPDLYPHEWTSLLAMKFCYHEVVRAKVFPCLGGWVPGEKKPCWDSSLCPSYTYSAGGTYRVLSPPRALCQHWRNSWMTWPPPWRTSETRDSNTFCTGKMLY